MLRYALILALLPFPAFAGNGEPTGELASVELLPGGSQGGDVLGAFRIRLRPGWKTYWRAPGDAGIPPVFDWKGSANLAGIDFVWPVPEVWEVNGLRSIGYHDELVLPFRIRPARPGLPVRLSGEINLGVCEEVCVPQTLAFDGSLSAGTPADPVVKTALGRRARNAGEAGVGKVACAVDPIADGLRLTARIALPPQGGPEAVAIETATEGVWVSDSTSQRQGGTLTATADIVPPNAQPFPLDRSKLRITVIGDGKAVDIQGCPAG